MSTTVLKEAVPVTVTVADCKHGGYAWIIKDLHLVGQSDTMEDLHADVNKDVHDLLKSLIKMPLLRPEDV